MTIIHNTTVKELISWKAEAIGGQTSEKRNTFLCSRQIHIKILDKYFSKFKRNLTIIHNMTDKELISWKPEAIGGRTSEKGGSASERADTKVNFSISQDFFE